MSLQNKTRLLFAPFKGGTSKILVPERVLLEITYLDSVEILVGLFF